MGNITQVHFKDGQECCYNITGLEQWDKGQKLEISGLDVDEYVEVHFSLQQYCGTAKRMLGKVEDGIILADIPALILEGPECLYSDTGVYYAYAWLYVSDEESAETIRKMEFVIKARPKPEEYVSPEDIGFLEQLEGDIKNKLDKSGHAPNKILATDAEGKVIAKDAEAEVDLSGYVKNTDYASNTEAGIMAVTSNCFAINNIRGVPTLYLTDTANAHIDNRSANRPINCSNYDYAVKQAMCDGKGAAWAVNEQKMARERIGATGEDQLLQFAIKPTTEKASFHSIQDSADYKVLDIGMDGKTEQFTTTGKQLFDIDDFKAQETLTRLSDSYIGYKLNTVSGQTYTFNRNTKAGYDVDGLNSVLILGENDTRIASLIDKWTSPNNRASVTFVATDEVYLAFSAGHTKETINALFDTYFVNPQLELGSVATSYEPYTGGQPSPNPEYPQDVVNAGEIYNLLNPEELENGLLLDENGNISTAGTYGDIYHIFKQTLPAGTYTLFVNGTRISVTRTILNGVFTNLNALVDKYTFTVESESEVTICFRKEDSSAFDGTEEIQLNTGANAKPYKPYTGRYEIEYKVANKNLWDKEYASSTNNWERVPDYIQSSGFYDMPIFVGKGNKFTLSYKDTLPAGLGIYAGIAMGHNKPVNYWFYNSSSSSLIYRVVTMTATEDNIWIRCNGGGRGSFMQYIGNDLQIEISSGETDYTPHQSQNITLTSPVPLTKWDKLVKRDGVYGWSIYGIKLVIDGTYNWYRYSSYNGFALGADILTNVMWRREGYCNQMPVYRGTDNVSTIGLLLGVGNKKIYNLYNPMYDETLEDYGASNWKAHVAENPLEIWTYEDEEQAFYPLPDEEQTLLKNLETYYGVTNILNDQGCPMWLTYVADTKLYIDNKILSIQTAMI